MGDYVNKSSIEYRISTGELPNLEEFKKYYIEEDHSFKDAMSHFNMTKSTLNSYINRFKLNKDHNKFGEQQEEVLIEEEKVSTDEKIQAQDSPAEQTATVVDVTINNVVIDDNSENSVDLAAKLMAYYNTLDDELEPFEKIFRVCYQFNLFYDEKLLKNISMEKQEDGTLKWFRTEELLSRYVYYLETSDFYKNKTFIEQIKRENFNVIYQEEMIKNSLTEDDKKNRQQAITLYGYDPFTEDRVEDLPQLYRDLSDLVNDSMRKDAAKKKAAIEIVRNYLNIKRYQKRVTDFMSRDGYLDADEQKALDQCLSMIAKIQDSINKTAKENSFTGGKSIGSNGKGMLSDVLEQVEGQGYDAGITNFYDIATSKAIESIADISNRSMLNQIQFSKTDYVDIITQQNKMVREAVETARKSKEALRLAKEKLTKQQLLVELEQEYRKKGIKEEEIDEFINREFNMVEEL